MTQHEKLAILTEAITSIRTELDRQYMTPVNSRECISTIDKALLAIKAENSYPELKELDLRIFTEFNVLGFDLNKGEYSFGADQSGVKMLIAAVQKGVIELDRHRSNVIAVTHIPPRMKNGRPQ